MRTYQKHTAPSMSIMSSPRHPSLLIPGEEPQQGTKIPCSAEEIGSQAIDFARVRAGNRENLPVISLLAGNFAMPNRRRRGGAGHPASTCAPIDTGADRNWWGAIATLTGGFAADLLQVQQCVTFDSN